MNQEKRMKRLRATQREYLETPAGDELDGVIDKLIFNNECEHRMQQYSTNVDHAWDLLKTFGRRERVLVNLMLHGEVDNKFTVFIGQCLDKKAYIRVTAETPPSCNLQGDFDLQNALSINL